MYISLRIIKFVVVVVVEVNQYTVNSFVRRTRSGIEDSVKADLLTRLFQ